MGGPRGDPGPVSQQGQPAPQRLSPSVPGVTCLLSHVSGVDDTLTGAPALSQEPPGPRGLSDQQDSPSLPYCALERVPTSYLSPHSPCSRWGRHTCTPQGGRCGRCPGSGMGWTSRDHTWPGQPGWGDLRQGGILVQWGGRGTGLGRTPRPHPGILACRDAWWKPSPQGSCPSLYFLWITFISTSPASGPSSVKTELKTAPASWGWKD